MCWLEFHNTVLCHYNVVNFHTNIHKRHPIAHPLGQGMGCLFYAVSDWYSASVSVIIYVIVYNIWPCYNGTWPYIENVTQYYLPDIIVTSDREKRDYFIHEFVLVRLKSIITGWILIGTTSQIGRLMGPTWGRQYPDGSHVGLVNLAIWVLLWKMNCDQLNSDIFLSLFNT